VLQYVNNGTDASPNYGYNTSISSFSNPRAIAINPVNTNPGEVVVAEGGSSQQVKAFNFAGDSLWTYGQAGGYYNSSGHVGSPAVTNDKLFLDTTNGSGGSLYANLTFLAFQPDGNSFWVGDAGNHRYLHLNDTGISTPTYNNQFSYLQSFYHTDVDPVANADGTLRVFADGWEYKFNPSVALQPGDPNASGGDGSWTLVNNWGVGLPYNYSAPGGTTAAPIEMITTLSGRTYGVMSNQSGGSTHLQLAEREHIKRR